MRKRPGSRVLSTVGWLAAAILACAVLVSVLPGCGSTPSSSASGKQPVFRIGMQSGSIQTLNPFLASYASDLAAYTYQYPMLFQYSQDLEAQPGLAKSWSTSADGKTWTFNLVSGAKWSDGKPITASDAAFTINTVIRLRNGVGAGLSVYTPGIEEASAPDPKTLVITLTRPQAALLSNMNGLPVLPEHVWAPLAAGDGGAIKSFTGDPKDGPLVVSGPFVVKSFDPKGTTIFSRVNSYYGPKPKISEWGWQVFSNSDAAIQALKNDQIDALGGIPATAVDALEGTAVLRVQGFGKGQLSADFLYTKGTERHPELRNPQVREAFNLAIDRQSIVDSAFRGFGKAGGSLFLSEWSPTYLSSPVPVPVYDVARANQILDRLGFEKGGDGIRVAKGVRMSYKLAALTARKATYGRAADAMRLNLAAIGVDLQTVWVDDPFTALVGPKADYNNGYDGYFGGIVTTPDPDWSLMEFTSQLLGVYNAFGYSNPALDKLYTEQSEQMNPEERKGLLDRAVAILQRDQVEVGLLYQQTIVAWNSRWQNIDDLGSAIGWLIPTAQDGFANIYAK